jgi:hypothetical protein
MVVPIVVVAVVIVVVAVLMALASVGPEKGRDDAAAQDDGNAKQDDKGLHGGLRQSKVIYL